MKPETRPISFFKFSSYLKVYKGRYKIRLVNTVLRIIHTYYDNHRQHVIHCVNKTQRSLILERTIHIMTTVLLIMLTALMLRRTASKIYILDIKRNLIHLTEKKTDSWCSL